jgi:hypothetical protein
LSSCLNGPRRQSDFFPKTILLLEPEKKICKKRHLVNMMGVSSLWFAVWPIIVSVRNLDEKERCFDEGPRV